MARACIDKTPRWKRRAREWRHAIGFKLYLLYAGTLYRPHMKLIHRRGWHWWTRLPMIGGPDEPMQDWCEWCGYRRMHHPPPKIDLSDPRIILPRALQ